MKLEYARLRRDVSAYLQSPESADVWKPTGHGVIFNLGLLMVLWTAGLLMMCTIILILPGLKLLRAVLVSLFTLRAFRSTRSVLPKQPERLRPILAASVIVGPSGFGLVLGALSDRTQENLDLLARKASEMADLYLEGDLKGESAAVVKMLHDDAYNVNRRRLVPDSHSEGHDLLLFDIEIDHEEVYFSSSDDDACGWVLCVVTDESQGIKPTGKIRQLPWHVAESSIQDTVQTV
ncbi:MAG: hypothetical protein MI757_04605 [Pirellulales bacterium]|nr:hypothetical protein [Pirellulales bacterium]